MSSTPAVSLPIGPAMISDLLTGTELCRWARAQMPRVESSLSSHDNASMGVVYANCWAARIQAWTGVEKGMQPEWVGRAILWRPVSGDQRLETAMVASDKAAADRSQTKHQSIVVILSRAIGSLHCRDRSW